MGREVTAIAGLNILAMKTLMYRLADVKAAWLIISILTGSP